jgi:hypothetical protein
MHLLRSSIQLLMHHKAQTIPVHLAASVLPSYGKATPRFSSSAAHDPQVKDFLTSFAKWQLLDDSGPAIKKVFSFKDSWTGERFVLGAEDLQARARRPFTITNLSASSVGGKGLGGKNNKGPPMDVEITIPAEKETKVLGEEQVALANAIDDIGATLQLGGGWG